MPENKYRRYEAEGGNDWKLVVVVIVVVIMMVGWT